MESYDGFPIAFFSHSKLIPNLYPHSLQPFQRLLQSVSLVAIQIKIYLFVLSCRKELIIAIWAIEKIDSFRMIECSDLIKAFLQFVPALIAMALPKSFPRIII